VSRSLKALALLRARQGDWRAADTLLTRSLEITQAVRGPEHPYLSPLLLDLADARDHLGRGAEARTLRERAARIQAAAGSH